jgi:carbamate kinase
MPTHRSAVVAVGGNALIGVGEHGTVNEETAHARRVAAAVARMIADGWSVVLTHGNGPQVGFILQRSDITADANPDLPPVPLFYCVAETQGGIGFLLESALRDELRELGLPDRVVTVMTQTLVRADDPAFANPTKPIGTFYTKAEANRYRRERGWRIVDDSGRGYRRVVSSPAPLRIIEADAVGTLLSSGFAVVACGGGGVPVVAVDGSRHIGIDAVIDKDRASGLLASTIGADLLVLCTGVDRVAIDFGKPTQRFVDRMTLDEAESLLADGQFPPGSMGPKIESALAFLKSGGKEVIITSPRRLARALASKTGTRISSIKAFDGGQIAVQ